MHSRLKTIQEVNSCKTRTKGNFLIKITGYPKVLFFAISIQLCIKCNKIRKMGKEENLKRKKIIKIHRKYDYLHNDPEESTNIVLGIDERI